MFTFSGYGVMSRKRAGADSDRIDILSWDHGIIKTEA